MNTVYIECHLSWASISLYTVGLHCHTNLRDIFIISMVWICHRMKIYREFNLVTWLRLVNFMELNISEFCFLYVNYVNYHYHLNLANLQ